MRKSGTFSFVAGSIVAAVWMVALCVRPAHAQEKNAVAIVERAIRLMGGDALRSVERVRLDMMTQWQRTNFREVPWSDRPSFEPHVDVRDYTIPAWRNTRDFGARTITNVVPDSVAITNIGQGFQPLSVAYVDERHELFAYTPDRLVLLVRDAPDLRFARDTVIGDERHAVLSATLAGRYPATVAFNRGTGLPAMLRFHAGQPNDFGLVPFGDMQVEVWYSNWRTFGAISLPTQWDIMRVGRPYKRMTVRSATFNPVFAADSFVVAADLREKFVASRKPMHDVPVDSVTVVQPGLMRVHGFGFPLGALQVGTAWVLLEAGHTPLNLERGIAALVRSGAKRPAAVIAGAGRTGNGGVVSLVKDGVPVYASAAAKPFIDVMLADAKAQPRGITVASAGQWLELGGERVRLEPVDLPDVHGSLLLYVPRLAWVYAPDVTTALDARIALERAHALGWDVKAMGTARDLWTAAG